MNGKKAEHIDSSSSHVEHQGRFTNCQCYMVYDNIEDNVQSEMTIRYHTKSHDQKNIVHSFSIIHSIIYQYIRIVDLSLPNMRPSFEK